MPKPATSRRRGGKKSPAPCGCCSAFAGAMAAQFGEQHGPITPALRAPDGDKPERAAVAATLALELEKLQRDVPVFLYHIKPRFHDEVVAEIRKAGGQAAILVSPESPEALAEALERAMAGGPAERALGPAQAAAFTWAATAARC